MATIDELVVKIKADIKDLESKMKKADSSVKSSSTKMKKSLDKTGKSATAFSKRMSNAATATAAMQGPLGPIAGRMRSFGALMGSAGFAAGALILAMAALVTMFKTFVGATMRAEMAMMKFKALVQSTGMAAGMTADQLEHFSKRMARDTLFSVQQVRDAAGVMLTFKAVTGDAFGRSMAVAGDLAAILGTDLKSAVLQLGKALENPRIGLSMLRRSGVSFTDSQKNLINALSDTGRNLEAMDMILASIEGQAGGVAEMMAGSGGKATLAGSFDELNRKIQLFNEQTLAGTRLMRGFADTLDFFSGAIPVEEFEDFTDKELVERLKEIDKAILSNAASLDLEERALKKAKDRFDEIQAMSGLDQLLSIGELAILPNALTGGLQRIKMLQSEAETLNNLLKMVSQEQIGRSPATIIDISPEKAPIIVELEKQTRKLLRTQGSLQIQIGKTGGALEALKFKQKMLNTIFKDGNDLFNSMSKSQKEAVDKMVEEVKKHAMATEQLQKSYNMVKSAVDKAFTVMENSILGLIDGTKNLKDVMKDMLRSFIADLAVAILKMLIFDKIKNAIMGGVSSAIGVPSDTPIAASASGGAIGSNQPMLVGERGPEIFMPRTAGSIINANDSKGMMSGGQGVTVVQNNNFAVGVTPTVRAEILNMMPLIKRETLTAVADSKQRGGGFRSALGNN